MNVVVNDLMTNYQKIGKGKPLVFLHGWGDSAGTFSAIADQLKDNYRIYALDLPGFGGTQAPPEAWGLSDYARFARAWINKLELKPAAIVGHSFGGAVAITGMAEGYLQSDRLVLLASAGIRGKKTLRNKSLRVASKVGRIPLSFLPPTKAQRLKQKIYKQIGSDALVVPALRQTFVKTVGEDIRHKATKIMIPTLLIYGSRDNETPISDGHIFNRAIIGSRMEVIGAGHFLHQERPAEVAKLITGFIGAN